MENIVYFLGEPGLYKIISLYENKLTAQELSKDAKILIRQINHTKIVSLDDISVFTNEGTVPIKDFFVQAAKVLNKNLVEKDILTDKSKLFSLFEQIMPNYNKEKVQQSDARKIMNWYNILQKVNFLDSIE